MNLFVAMLSSTYDKISEEAREEWKLHRARCPPPCAAATRTAIRRYNPRRHPPLQPAPQYAAATRAAVRREPGKRPAAR